MPNTRYIYDEDGEIVGVNHEFEAEPEAGEDEDVCEITSRQGDLGWCQTHEQFHRLDDIEHRRE